MEANISCDKPKSITLIPLDWQSYDRRSKFMRSRGFLRQLGWKCDVKFADRRYTDARVTGAEIKQLIQRCTTEKVAIVDEHFTWDQHLATWLSSYEDKSEIHCAVQLPKAAKRGTGIFLMIYTWIVRVLLRTSKTFFRPGMVVFYRNQNFGEWIRDSDEFLLSEFLALARLNGRKVCETVLTSRQTPENPIHSRSVIYRIKAAIRFAWNEMFFPAPDRIPNHGRKSFRSFRLGRQQQLMGWVAIVVAAVTILLSSLSFEGGGVFRQVSPALSAISSWCFLLFGVSETVARLPFVAASIGTVLITVILGRRLIGFRAALVGAVLMLASLGFVVESRVGTPDSWIALFVTCSLLCGYVAVYRAHFKSKWWFLSSLACALGVLTGGLVTIGICIPPLLLWTWTQLKDKHLFRLRPWLMFLAIQLAVIGPVVFLNPEFLSSPVVNSNTYVALSGMEFVGMWLVWAFPTTLLLPSTFVRLFGRTAELRESRNPSLGFLLLCVFWILSFLAWVAPALEVPIGYLPLMSFLCLLVGWALDQTVFAASTRAYDANWFRKAPKRIGHALMALILLVQAIVVFYYGQSQLFWPFMVVVPLVLGVIARLSFRRRSSKEVAWLGLGAVALVLSFYCGSLLLPSIAATDTIPHSAKQLLEAGVNGIFR